MHTAFDKDLCIIRNLLLECDRKNAEYFEGAVATLAFLLGFSVAHYGKNSKMQDGPDIIPMTPARRILVIECTIGIPDKENKISRLFQRIELLKEQLRLSDRTLIQGIIVTPLKRDQVEVGLKQALDKNILVITKEDLQELLNRARLIPNADALFEEIRKRLSSVWNS